MEGGAGQVEKLAGRQVGMDMGRESIEGKLCHAPFLCYSLPAPLLKAPWWPPNLQFQQHPHPNLQGLEAPDSWLLPSRGSQKSIWLGPWALAGGICLQFLTQ